MDQEAGQALLAIIPEIKDDLPFSPDLLSKLFSQTAEDSYASLAQISSTISRDQGLTARILSLANSAFYGLQAEVSTVERAVAMLGFREVRTMILSLGVSSLTRKLRESGLLDLDQYWRHQLLTACCAKTVAEAIDLPPDDMFTCGLLHDLGYLITAIYMPDEFQAAAALRASDNLTTAQAEMRHFGLDHGVVGAMVLASWDLPPRITEPINWHHSPGSAPAFEKHAACLNVSDSLALMFENPSYAAGQDWQEFMTLYELDADALTTMLGDFAEDEGTKELLRAFRA